MPFTNPYSALRASAKLYLGPAVSRSGQLNPKRLALATRGHWIQSRILHISDRWGFFSPGPPLLQIQEASIFIFLMIFLGETVFHSVLAVFVASLYDDDDWGPGRPAPCVRGLVALCAFILAFVVGVWLHMCLGEKRRGSSWAWVEEGKLHTE